MTIYPLTTLAAQVSQTGISAPTFADDLASLQASFQLIFGSDAYLSVDSQDGQWLGIIAQAVNDTNALAFAVYNSFSPATAQGIGLSTVVKINGLARESSSNSTVNVVCTGTPLSVITSGVIADVLGNQFKLPTFIMPPGGSITLTAVALNPGAINGGAGTVATIVNPQRGWLSVTNPAGIVPGLAVETDAQLRQRQSFSTGNNALTPLKTLTGLIAALPGVVEVQPYENVGSTTDANGLPGHSISMVVLGGVASDIASIILNKKTEGANTYGSTSVTVNDYAGVPKVINFFVPASETIQVHIALTALTGFSTATESLIQNAVANYINSLLIGQSVYLSKLYVPANLGNDSDGTTYDITAITVGVNGGGLGTADIPILFNQQATCIVSDVTFTVV